MNSSPPQTPPPRPGSNKPGWDDEDEWGVPPQHHFDPAKLPPVKPSRRPNVVQWMYIVVAILIAAQIAHFYLTH